MATTPPSGTNPTTPSTTPKADVVALYIQRMQSARSEGRDVAVVISEAVKVLSSEDMAALVGSPNLDPYLKQEIIDVLRGQGDTPGATTTLQPEPKPPPTTTPGTPTTAPTTRMEATTTTIPTTAPAPTTTAPTTTAPTTTAPTTSTPTGTEPTPAAQMGGTGGWSYVDGWDPSGSEKVTKQQATEILTERLNPETMGGVERFGRQAASWLMPAGGMATKTQQEQLIEKLYYVLPEAMRTREVFERASLTGILAAVAAPDGTFDSVIVNGQKFDPAERWQAQKLYDIEFASDMIVLSQDPDIIQAGGGRNPNTGQPNSQEAVDMAAREKAIEIASGELVPIRQSKPSTPTGTEITPGADGGPATITPSNSGQFDPGLIGSSAEQTAAPTPLWSNQDIETMLRFGESIGSTFGQYKAQVEDNALLGADAAYDPTRVNLGGNVNGAGQWEQQQPDWKNRIGRSTTTPADANSILGGGRGSGELTLFEALHAPATMTREQLIALSNTMKAAGIYDQMGGAEPTVLGSSTDPQFQAAWRLVTAQTLQNNRPPSQWLVQQAQVLEQQKADARAKGVGVVLTDSARLRIQANVIGRSILGRGLSTEEQASLVGLIHGMQKDVAVQADDPTAAIEAVDWEARMMEQIRASNPEEAGDHDMALGYTQFKSMLAGPGRMMTGGPRP